MTQAPGWYREPTDPSVTRYWDGSTWTAQRVWTESGWIEPGAGASPTGGAPPIPGPRMPPPAQRPYQAPTGAGPRSSSRKILWYAIAGCAVIAVAIIAVTVVIIGRSGGSGASRAGSGGGSGGQTVDYLQYQADVQLLGKPGLNLIDPQLSVNADNTPLPSDCTQAATDVAQLQADSRTWPRVLSAPMSQAENAFSAAASDCSNGDFTTMQTNFDKGQGYLSATQDAFKAHCRQTDDVTKWQC